MLKIRFQTPADYKKDVIQGIFQDIVNNAQPTGHYISSAVPGASEGSEGEIRLVFDGANYKICAKINGLWKSGVLS